MNDKATVVGALWWMFCLSVVAGNKHSSTKSITIETCFTTNFAVRGATCDSAWPTHNTRRLGRFVCTNDDERRSRRTRRRRRNCKHKHETPTNERGKETDRTASNRTATKCMSHTTTTATRKLEANKHHQQNIGLNSTTPQRNRE